MKRERVRDCPSNIPTWLLLFSVNQQWQLTDSVHKLVSSNFLFLSLIFICVSIYISSANHKTLITVYIPSMINSCCKHHSSTANIEKLTREFQIPGGGSSTLSLNGGRGCTGSQSNAIFPIWKDFSSQFFGLQGPFTSLLFCFYWLIMCNSLSLTHFSTLSLEPHFRFQRIFFQTEFFCQRSIPYQILSWVLLQSCSTKSSGYVNENAQFILQMLSHNEVK